MRSFIVLCLVAVACAEQSGYNYESGSGLSFAPGAGSIGGDNIDVEFGGNIGGGFGGNIGDGFGGNIGDGFGGNIGDGFGGNFGGGFGGNDASLSHNAPAYSAPSAEFDKEFYSFSAPEAEFDDANAAQRIAGSVKQGLRVVFIKGPENKGLEDAALALARQAAQQKTAIYVLNKQADIGDLANKLNNINKGANSRPDVHFVKYRTPEDAANAQRAIQSQYDSLGGNSQNINGGVAPVINFASQAPISGAVAHAPQNAYLPSSVFRLR